MSLATLHREPVAGIGHNHPPDFRALLAEAHAQLRHDVEKIAARANVAPKAIKTEDDLFAVGEIVKDARKVAKQAEQTRVVAKEPHLVAGRDVDAFFGSLAERLKRVVSSLEERATEYQRAKAGEERRIREEQARKAREEEDRQREIAEREASKQRPVAAAKHEDRADEAADRAVRAAAAAQVSAAELTRVRSETGIVASTRTTWDFEIIDLAKISLDTIRPYLLRADIEKAIRAYVRVGGRELAGVRIFQDEKAAFR